MIAGTAAAQAPIHTWYGPNGYDGLGRAIANAGDINNDGRSDIIVGVPLGDPNGQESGQAYVYDGATGAQLRSYDGLASRDEFGYSVTGCGDVTGDGIDDFAVGAYLADVNGTGSGTVTVYNGATTGVVYTFDGDGPQDAMGTSLGYLGDVNGDGYADILVGSAERAGGVSSGNGYVRVFSGQNGSILYTVNGGASNDQFGYSVAGGRDIDGDGVNDWIAGAYGEDTNGTNAGSASVHSGANGNQLFIVYGDNDRDRMGSSVALIGDVNGDGNADFLACAEDDDNAATDAGMARVFDGSNGNVLTSIDGQGTRDRFGWSCSDAGDLDGDGREDFLVGASYGDGGIGADTGYVEAYSGMNFAMINRAEGPGAGDRLGFSCTGLGDVNGDGVPDWAAGGAQYGGSAGGSPGNGVAEVYDPTQLPPPPPPRWPNLPTTFAPIGSGYSDDFESYAGVVPTHFGINELNSQSRSADPDAWCNIGQHGLVSGQNANSGLYQLELGGNWLGMSSNHDVSNGLVIGLNGAGTAALEMDLWVFNHGEENQGDDGIFLSEDGLTWVKAYNTAGVAWNGLPASWSQITDIDLSATGVNTSGDFYLLIAQQDNFPFAQQDGVGVDDIEIGPPGGGGGPVLAITPNPPIAGQNATLTVSNNNPGDLVRVGFSLTGGGPLNTAFGIVYLTPPIRELVPATANASGVATFTAAVPGYTSGWPAWIHGLNVNTVTLTNALAVTIQ